MLATAKRLRDLPAPTGCGQARFPIALLFVRGDRGGDGKKIAEQIVSSFDYWDKDTGDNLDIVLAGWKKDEGKLTFDIDDFLLFRRLVESSSKWRFSGETDLLLLNFEVDLWAIDGRFDYSEVIVLPLEEMLRSKYIGSVDAFVSELSNLSREISARSRFEGNSPVWELSDSTGIQRVKKDIWQAIKKLILKDYADKYDGLANFAVRDLQHDLSKPIKLPFERMQEVRRLIEAGSK
jgi:hypothetical protein